MSRKINRPYTAQDMKTQTPLTATTKGARIAEQIAQLKAELPHRELPWYVWAHQFYESRNKMNFLTAANQIGKSTTMQRKNIEWACNMKLWPELWPDRAGVPNLPRQFWYFYPSSDVVNTEVYKKWIPDVLPRGLTKAQNPQFGWDLETIAGEVNGIHFNSGVSIYFKTYAQKAINLQASTIHMVTADEEMPEELFDEIMARLSATGGYFNMGFTATLGLPLWYRTMECQGKQEEAFKTAAKWQVSLYDCQVFKDGKPGLWDLQRIKEREAQCSSEAEILRRVHGKFVRDEGRKFANFNPGLCVIPADIPRDWQIYGGVDIGSGGSARHRSKGAIVIIAVSPDFSKGRVIDSWRGDFMDTTAQDILYKFKDLTRNRPVVQACYDYQSREFGIIASRSGIPFIPADKARQTGEQTLNVLFRAEALLIDEGRGDNEKLVTELMTIPAGDKNRKFVDDLADALRYTCAMIPWDFTKMKVAPEGAPDTADPFDGHDDFKAPPVHLGEKEYQAWEIRQRRGDVKKKTGDGWEEFYSDIEEWQGTYDGD